MTTRDKIKQRLEDNNVRHWANDNIADYIEEGEKQQLIDEAVPAFENRNLIYYLHYLGANKKKVLLKKKAKDKIKY